jgi:Cu/Ag efflux pump CusA
MWYLGFNISVAVAVGFIALACLAADTILCAEAAIPRPPTAS